MTNFINTLAMRNGALFYSGLICFIMAALFFLICRKSQIKVNNTNAWYKPLKFALSIGIFCWTMGWLLFYLKPEKTALYTWVSIALLAFELFYIAFQAGRGQLSHFNISTPFYNIMYALMGIAISVVTLWTGYIGYLFFTEPLPMLPANYIWGIRMGIILFVIFAFEGGLMGSRMSHTVGGPDGEEGLPFLNWSKKYGDTRIAHFIGMHALQVLPLLSFYVLTSVTTVIVVSAMYGLLALFVLIQALKGKPLIAQRKPKIVYQPGA
ncbi:hypothetical protein [Mucilaginibacter auburnensis]|uniref:Uncharacterized protein n=1 Tax=Mucilaginibacter auburnensis TaxID=1457233 RepID=A0A2H9VMN6_9SPHI|nr:hypothetical protein [Mucilaginibacter auburnensis]PJJ79586.1 hypothetical protein CLV57_2720 [Mucilaginibacter auburnensis]